MTYAQAKEDRAQLWLRLEQLNRTVADVKSAALVVSNMARYRDDSTLKQLAQGLLDVHSTLSGQHADAVAAVRQCLANDNEGPRPKLALVH